MFETSAINQDKKEVIKNLYLSGIGEEFIALQNDLEIPVKTLQTSGYDLQVFGLLE